MSRFYIMYNISSMMIVNIILDVETSIKVLRNYIEDIHNNHSINHFTH